MQYLEHVNLAYSFSGLVIGMLVGITGVGGGSLMTPLLILLFGFHPATAVGTDLLYAAATKTVGTAVHGASKTVDWRIVGRLAAGSVPACALIVIAFHLLSVQGKLAGQVITISLGAIVFVTAAALVFRPYITRFYASHVRNLSDARVRYLTILVGAIVGTLVTLTSVGAGVIGVTALVMLYPDLPVKRIVGSDIAHAVPLTLIAGSGYFMIGAVDMQLLVSLLVGSIPGIVVGSLLANRVSEATVRYILATALVPAGSKLLGLF
jgi:uncharacterized membrane protein YfcA